MYCICHLISFHQSIVIAQHTAKILLKPIKAILHAVECRKSLCTFLWHFSPLKKCQASWQGWNSQASWSLTAQTLQQSTYRFPYDILLVNIYWQSHLDKWASLPKPQFSPLLNEDTKDTHLQGLTTGLKKKIICIKHLKLCFAYGNCSETKTFSINRLNNLCY